MQVKYSEPYIHFSFEKCTVDVLNIIFERFERTIPLHSHGDGSYEIHYIQEGYGQLTAEDKRYDITPNTLFVTGPHVRHAQTPVPQDPMQEYCIYLRVMGDTPKNREKSILLSQFLDTAFWFGQDRHGMSTLVKQLFDELEKRRIGYRKQIEMLIAQMMICMVRNYESGMGTEKEAGDTSQEEGRAFLIEEYFLYEYQKPSLKELAGRLLLSERQTQRLLQNLYGKTFLQKKVEARMSAAAVLLQDPEKSVTVIAEELGYSSLEHFSAEFRRYYGMSPRKYRQARP
ncbi:MAG: AraC family transcriptional regulator [Clostridiales bacterium]|nr:AraC family transcriptional regulator [Clostridiales bacterium]